MLRDTDIENYQSINNNFIRPYRVSYVQPSSYDLRVGKEYRFSFEKKNKKLRNNLPYIRIPKYSLCFILTEETICLPNNISATLHPRHRLVKEGLLMYPQPPIDPGYKGRLYILLHNLTNKSRFLKKGEHVASIVFYELDGDVDNPYGSKNEQNYQDADTLEKLGLNNDFFQYDSALGSMEKELGGWKTDLLSKWLPMILTIITLIIMILTIIFFFIGGNGGN